MTVMPLTSLSLERGALVNREEFRRWVVRAGLTVSTMLSVLPGGFAADKVGLDVVTPAEPPAAIQVADLKRHAAFLASDTLEGRLAGSRGSQAAASYLVQELKLAGCQPGSGQDYRQVFGAGYTNILALVPGVDPELTREVLVIGGHYDHVGLGTPQNSYGPFGRIHNGADDNASGIAVLLELAQFLAQQPHKRTILFACWDAEETGLLGSQHWVRQPTVELPRVKLALNLDMIGRLRNQEVTTMGWRSAAGLRPFMVAANRRSRLEFRFDSHISADSDHHSFYAARIPVLHFDTGKHEDYHRPSDDVEKLNWTGLETIGIFLAELITATADTPRLPPFRLESWNERAPTSPAASKTSPPVRFGVTWEPGPAREGRMIVREVVLGAPAASIGLRPGDRLIAFGRWQEGSDLAELRREITRSPIEVTVAWVTPGTESPRTERLKLQGAPTFPGYRTLVDAALPGCGVIDQVIETSAADHAGLYPGDVLLRVNDDPVSATIGEGPTTGVLRLSVERRGVPFEVVLDP
jgi:hypothetical protein